MRIRLSYRAGLPLLLLVSSLSLPSRAQDAEDPRIKMPVGDVSPSIARLAVFSRGEQVGNGTGFVIRADGVLVTNHHVVDDVHGKMRAIFDDGSEYQVLGTLALDEEHDLAIIKIEANGLPALRLAKPAEIAVGDPMFLLGSSRGLDSSLGTGIVAALRDEFPEDWKKRAEKENRKITQGPLVQHTAASAPGSSGSPIMNRAGEVIGVHHSSLIGSPIYFAAHVRSLQALLDATDLDASPRPLSDVRRNLLISAAVFGVLILAFVVIPRLAQRRRRAAER